MSYGGDPPSGLKSIIAISISLALAFISLKFVEQPVRRKILLKDRRQLFAAAGAGTIIFLAIGLTFEATKGFPSRFRDYGRLSMLVDEKRWSDPRDDCISRTKSQIAADQLCIRGRAGVAPTFALIGDSHAEALAPAVFGAADKFGVSGVQITSSGFMPMPGRRNLGINYSPDLTPEVLNWLDRNTNIRTIIVTGYWLYEATSRTYRNLGTVFADDSYDGSGMAYNPKALQHALGRLAEHYPDRSFVLLDDVPSGRELYAKN
jgi:hypothetical protein